MKLFIATANQHKLSEICAIFRLPSIELKSMKDFPDLPEVVEDGDTFDANAIKKAVTIAGLTGMWTIADDTGLEVDALDGAPGVYSARYAGESANYDANNEKLLSALDGVDDRTARFRCVIALSDSAGNARTVEGRCEGRILKALSGGGGFGYDPLFMPAGYDQTFAEMDIDEKNRISHRAVALQKARDAWFTGAELKSFA